MIQPEEELIRFLFVIMVLSILVPLAEATTISFTVPKGEEVPRSIRLAVEDRVLIEFTVVGQTGSTLNFYITGPHGSVKVEYRKTSNVNYCFVCDEAGEYVLHFSNIDASDDKLVTLNYEVQHYIFGIPQTLFLTIIIVLICVGAVATFILMGKTR